MLLNSRIFKALISCVLVLSLALSVMIPAFAAPEDVVSVNDKAANEMLEDWIDTYVYYIDRVDGIPEAPQDALNVSEGGPTNGPILFEGIDMKMPEIGEPCGATTYRWSDKWMQRKEWEQDRNLPRETDYWISAIQFQAICDVYEYMDDNNPLKDDMYQLLIDLYDGFWFSGNHPTWDVNFPDQNYYNDDQGWWMTALARGFRLTGDIRMLYSSDYLCTKLYKEYDRVDWAAQGLPNAWGGAPWGGIPWRRVGNDVAVGLGSWGDSRANKNFCTEGNVCYGTLTLARTYKELADKTEDPELKAEYMAKYEDRFALGQEFYEWNKFHYIDLETGRVTNGSYRLDNQTNHATDGISYPTRADGYNHGTAIGSSFEMWRLTGEEKYLDEAKFLLDYALDQWTLSDGLTMDCQGTGDDAAWKNILWYIAADMCYNGGLSEYEKYFEANAYQAWNHRNDLGLCNNAIQTTSNGRQVSICTILGVNFLYWADFDPDKDYGYQLIGMPVEGRYEAEGAEYSDVAFQGDASASGGQTVQYWDADSAHVATGYVKFKVDAEVAGEYNINLVWKSRNQVGSRHIQVNDGPDEKFEFPAGNNNQFVTTAIPATLNKGENTIKVSYWNNDLHAGEKDTQSWWFLDYLEIELVKADEAAAEEMLDAWLATFLADRTTKDGGTLGLTSWRWSDKWQERQMDVDSGEPRETDFWLSGIVFESFNDVLEYGHNDEYKAKIEEIMYGLYEGFAKSENHPNWDVDTWQENTYNDDLCWWSLAMLRAYQLTGEKEYFDLSKALLDKLLTDYDTTEGFGGEPYGGILWRRSEAVPVGQGRASKDACANGNAGMITYRFAQYYKQLAKAEKDATLKAEYQALEQHYAEYADNIYTWTMAHLYRDSDAYVTNSINENGSRNEAQFTYNYGVIAGAAYERYLYTGDKQYLERATRIMDSAFNRFTQSDGYTIKTEGTGDSAGFKTIMLRVAADMYNDGNAPQYKDYLEVNAVRAYRNRRDSDGLVGDNIRQTPADNARLCSPCAILGPSLLYWAGFSANTESADSWAWSGSEEANKYEAEWARLYHMQIAANQYDGNSGYDDIWYWDNGGKDGYVEFLVEAPKAGGYMLNFHYLQRAASQRTLTVNGNEIGNINFLGGSQWDDATAIVTLAEGKNTVRLSFTGNETWNYLDYLLVTSATATVDKKNVKVNEEFVIKVVTESNVTRVGLVNENGKYLGKKSVEAVENEDGTITWSITTAMTTKGDRTIGVVVDSGNGELKATPIATVEVSVSEEVGDATVGATINEAVRVPETAKKNEAFTVTVVTSTGVSNVGIFNENGKAIGKISQNCVDNAEGERTWTITIKVGSRGVRNFTVKAADAAGNWVAEQAATITIK